MAYLKEMRHPPDNNWYPLVLHDVAAPQTDFLVSATKMSFE
jgi:hypothetical protein